MRSAWPFASVFSLTCVASNQSRLYRWCTPCHLKLNHPGCSHFRRAQSQRFLVFGDGLVKAAFCLECDGEIVVRGRVARSKLCGEAVLRDGIIKAALVFQGDGQVVVRVAGVRINADGFDQVAHRFINPAGVEQGGAEIIVGDPVVLRHIERVTE